MEVDYTSTDIFAFKLKGINGMFILIKNNIFSKADY